MSTMHDLERRFREFAKEIWGDSYDFLTKSTWTFKQGQHEIRANNVLAAVVCNGRQSASGRTILARCPSYIIYFSDRLLEDTDDEKVDKVLKHEVLHLGYHKHTAAFYAVAHEVGAAITESAANGEKPYIEIKEGARFKKFMEFETFQEAKAYAQNGVRTPGSDLYGKRVRITGSAMRTAATVLRGLL